MMLESLLTACDSRFRNERHKRDCPNDIVLMNLVNAKNVWNWFISQHVLPMEPRQENMTVHTWQIFMFANMPTSMYLN